MIEINDETIFKPSDSKPVVIEESGGDAIFEIPLKCISKTSFLQNSSDIGNLSSFANLTHKLLQIGSKSLNSWVVNKLLEEVFQPELENIHRLAGTQGNENTLNSLSDNTNLTIKFFNCDLKKVKNDSLSRILKDAKYLQEVNCEIDLDMQFTGYGSKPGPKDNYDDMIIDLISSNTKV